MGTRYEEVYERYRGQVRNYEFLDYDAVTREAMQLDLLKMAISDFEDVCKQDLNDREDDLLEFNIRLTNREKDILALGMIVHFVRQYVYNTDALQNGLSTKDFTLFSPANLLEKMTTLLTTTERQQMKEINLYSFRNGEIASLTE